MSANTAEQTDIPALMRDIATRARKAYAQLAEAKNEEKDMALVGAAMAIRENEKKIIEANAKDMEFAKQKGLSGSMLDRLQLNPERIEGMATGLETVTTLPDPVNKIIDEWERPNGLTMQRVSIPLGVIGIIYESRPNVTADAAGLCLKSGNAAILRGGSESLHSSTAIAECFHRGLKDAGLPADAVQLVPTRDRAAVGEMLTAVGLIDIIVPRGGRSLTERVQNDSKVPTILHLDGNCHCYIHESAAPDMAVDIVVNAKFRRTGICGATESVLIDEKAAGKILPRLIEALAAKDCEIRGDEKTAKLDKRVKAATEEDWGTEYLDAIISIKQVKNVDEAVDHINRYGSHHTDAIISEDMNAARKFMRRVDSSIVIHNASTQFADGGEFGFGAEIGISTGRLHARGPVGAEQLTTYKYVVHGNGQTRP